MADRVTFLESDLADLDAALGPFDVIIGMIYTTTHGLTGLSSGSRASSRSASRTPAQSSSRTGCGTS